EAPAAVGLEWEPMWEIGAVVADHTTTDLMSGVVTTVFQPNYRVQRRLSLMQNRESEPAHQRVGNLAPGEYKLQYDPCGAYASFRVVPADGVGVIAQAAAPWLEQRTEGVRVSGQPAHCAGIVAGVLRSDNEFVTVVSDVAHDICDEPRGLGGTLTTNAAVRRLAPFTRLSAGKSPASSLTIRSDATGEATIELVDQEGRRQVFRRRMTEASQVR
ncbi:MAG: hypothetical protein KGN36_21645, partial [Acidobacteriota bacterium]|nr:hypothetical protein [Acidobacteriota bacterium]